MGKRVLVFSAHPDDDIIGCGGSLAKHVKSGNQVTVCYLTSGESGSLDYAKQELAKLRENEAKEAGRVIGFKGQIFLRYPDGYLEYKKSVLKRLIELVRRERPNVVYVHDSSDGHQDHRITSQLIGESIGRAGGPWFQECKGKPWATATVLAYEVWTPLFEFNYVEDISDFMGKKLIALRKHASQIKNIRYDEAAESLSRYRGIMTGKGKYCEVFKIIRATESVVM
jgi:LmbE family N-acetylglucosaminyl deacetylase